jgi:hypothetical protein
MMRWIVVVLGVMGTLLVAGPAQAEVFVVGPGMLGHPGDDPSVGYSALALELAFVYPESALPFAFTPAGGEAVSAGPGVDPGKPGQGALGGPGAAGEKPRAGGAGPGEAG